MPSVYDKAYISRQVPDANPKRLIIACDGTWQSSVELDPKKGVPSNITRLCRVIASNGTGKDENGKEIVWPQIVHYDAGVGTGDHSWKGIQSMKEGSVGIGLLENVVEAYNFLVNNYSHGDHLFFFGFSRGAYTARSAAGLVSEIGVVKPAFMGKFLEIYTAYTLTNRKIRTKQFSKDPRWLEFVKVTPGYAATNAADVVIQVIGVFDTVGALGIPKLYGFTEHDMSQIKDAYEFLGVELSDNVKHAYQALALDEFRGAFTPSLWKLKAHRPDPNNPSAPRKKNVTKLVQCWFPGAHINIGGGSSSNATTDPKKPPTGDKEQLASLTYAWMLDRIHPHLALDMNVYNLQLSEFKAMASKPLSDSVLSPTTQGWWDWTKSWFTTVETDKAPPEEGYGIGIIDDSMAAYFGMYKMVGGRIPRKPGQYHDSNHYTTERIHPSVYYRMRATTSKERKGAVPYQPEALKGWERRAAPDNIGKKGDEFVKRGGWVWEKPADPKVPGSRPLKLVEWEIADLPGITGAEKTLLQDSWVDVTDLHKEVVAGWENH